MRTGGGEGDGPRQRRWVREPQPTNQADTQSTTTQGKGTQPRQRPNEDIKLVYENSLVAPHNHPSFLAPLSLSLPWSDDNDVAVRPP